MYASLGYMDDYPNQHIAELIREAENERLAYLATGPHRPLRAAIAEWLVAAAEWIEGRPRESTMQAHA
jgi:hypothetical protein